MLYPSLCIHVGRVDQEREIRSLNAVNDNYPKYILSMDRPPYNDFEGIRQIYIP